jgi:hypothetical protein
MAIYSTDAFRCADGFGPVFWLLRGRRRCGARLTTKKDLFYVDLSCSGNGE